MNRPLPAPYRDVALLLTRVLLGVIMFAHGYQKMVINGIGRTTQGFESLSIPLAIVSASFVTVVEFAGSVMLIAGVLTPFVAGCNLVIMTGAAVFVHAKNGIFIADGGWELVGAIGAAFLALAALGPGRYSLDHLIAGRQRQHRQDMDLATGGLPVARGGRAVPFDRYAAMEASGAFEQTAYADRGGPVDRGTPEQAERYRNLVRTDPGERRSRSDRADSAERYRVQDQPENAERRHGLDRPGAAYGGELADRR